MFEFRFQGPFKFYNRYFKVPFSVCISSVEYQKQESCVTTGNLWRVCTSTVQVHFCNSRNVRRVEILTARNSGILILLMKFRSNYLKE